jgi:hypothetical protein
MKRAEDFQRIYPSFEASRLGAEQAGARSDDRQEFSWAHRAREFQVRRSLLGNCERNQEGEAGTKEKAEPPIATTGGRGTTEEWMRFSTIHPPRAVAGKVKVHGIKKQGRILARAGTHGFFPSGDTAAPDPSFRVWIASTGRSPKRSTSPLGQRISTRSIFVAAPSPKCTLMSLLEM